MSKKKKIILSISLAIVLMVSILKLPFSQEIYQQIGIFTEVFNYIRQYYVEDVQEKDLIYGACKGMTNVLDPYSEFLSPQEHKIMKSDAQGEFGGLGIRISVIKGVLTVITPLPGTPAFKAGILPGDQIIKIEGISTLGITSQEAMEKMRGKPGSKVTITIKREEEEPFDLTIERAVIYVESIYSKMLADNIGYIRLTEFSQHTATEFDDAYQKLKKDGMTSLILDLRNNPGGLLNSAVEICKRFIGEEKMIVYTQGRKEEGNLQFFADKEAKFAYLPLVILVNKGSASGSEVVAGCIKDWGRGIILGEKTFGKASVQTILPLSDGSGLKLTTAKYYTPQGICIHEIGIEPDIKVEVPPEEAIKIAAQMEEIYGLTQQQAKEKELEKIVDKQLERAKEILIALQKVKLP